MIARTELPHSSQALRMKLEEKSQTYTYITSKRVAVAWLRAVLLVVLENSMDLEFLVSKGFHSEH